MRTTIEILTTFRDLADKHGLWQEIEQYGKLDRAWVESALQRITNGQMCLEVVPDSHQFISTRPDSLRTITTTELSALCFGAAISSFDLVDGTEIVPAGTAWQRNLNRHGVKHKLSKHNPSRISEVQLELTPEEWCSVGMNEGCYYLSSDCTGLQDIMNTAFRFSGWVSSSAIQRFAVLSRDKNGDRSPCHDTALLDRWFSRIERLSPWERLGCLWQLAVDH